VNADLAPAAQERGSQVDAFVARWPAMRPFLGIGSVSVVAGGLVAALTRPTGFELGSWLAAYLVLVGGVAQIALGTGQAWLADEPPRATAVNAEVATWNLGVAATVVGTLAAAPVVTTLGGIATALALVLFLVGVRMPGPAPRWALIVYRWVVAIVLVSIPVGLALAWIRHG
jgi:hypothetical protein